MARFVDLGLTRIFRSRWGVALVIALLVLTIVGVGRIFSEGTGANSTVSGGSPAPAASTKSNNDDSVTAVRPPPKPTTSPGLAEPEAVAYAFASAWVDHKGVSQETWHERIVPNATQRINDQLQDVDPAAVPASKVIGRPSLIAVGDGLVNAVITTDSGKLTLRLIAPTRHWLVDGVDWESA